MTKNTITITDENGLTITRDMTDAESIAFDKHRKEGMDKRTAHETAEAAKAEAKAALLERLAITADEAALLLG